jgi:hypothetical protein
MIEQVSNALVFLAFYVESKLGKTGLTVTVDVRRNGTLVVTGGSAVEVGGGLYSYTLASASNTVEGEYAAVFKTATTTVDQREIPALWVVQKAGVENIDAAVSSRSSHSAADVWTAATRTLTSISALAAQIASAVLDAVAATYNAAASIGAKINLIGSSSFTLASPVSTDGTTLSLVRGDDYKAADSRQVTFTATTWPNLTGVTSVTLTMRDRDARVSSGGTDPVVFSVMDVVASRVVGSGTQTLVFEFDDTDTDGLDVGTAAAKYDVEALLSTRHLTLVTGLVNVTEDQTR